MKSRIMIALAILAIVVLYGAYTVWLFWDAAQKSAPLIRATPPFNRADPSLQKSILIMGDSLGVGVGAPSELTVAGRLSTEWNSNVENYSKSGALTREIEGQMSQAQKDRYDLILIQIGANDVITLRSLSKAEKDMDSILEKARKKSDRVVLLTAGNIGDAPLWPFPWPYIHTKRTLDLRARFMALAEKHGAIYVDLYSRGNLFATDPARYYANDNLHLTAEGYAKWFDVIREEIVSTWPEFSR